MRAMNASSIRSLIGRAQALAQELATKIPQAPVYRIVIDQLAQVDASLPLGFGHAFEAARGLGIIAVRELDDDDEGPPRELRQLLIKVREALRELAGLPEFT